jgi:hypothetical protein
MIFIISYREHDWDERSGSSFECWTAATDEDALDHIAKLLFEDLDACWTHILARNFEDLCAVVGGGYSPTKGSESINFPVADDDEDPLKTDKMREHWKRCKVILDGKLAVMKEVAKAAAEAEHRLNQATAAKRKEEQDRITYLALKARFEP